MPEAEPISGRAPRERSDPAPLEVGANAADRRRNRALGAGVVDDPYPVYHALRRSGPVHEGAISAAFGLEGPDTLVWRDRRQFSCYDWQTVEAVLRDTASYSSEWYEPTLEPVVGRSLIQLDDRAHRRARSLVMPAFSRREMERWKARWVRPVVDEILDGLLARGAPVDLYRALCAVVPVSTIARSLGVPAADVPRFHELAIASVAAVGDMAERLAAARQISDALAALVAERRARRGDDLLSWLCDVEFEDPEDGSRHRLADEEVLTFARLLLPAGAGTTYRGLGCLLLALLETGQWELLREDASRIDAAIEEALRWEQPLTAVGRIARRDCELAGVAIPAGSALHACLGAANHDPARWSDPDRFDLTREPRPHASFGIGPHLCVGLHLARMEMRCALEALLERAPELRLDPSAPAPCVTGLLFRMPTALPVLLHG